MATYRHRRMSESASTIVAAATAGAAGTTLGLSLRGLRTQLVCGAFATELQRTLGLALQTGARRFWLDVVSPPRPNAPFDHATADLLRWVGREIRAARALDEVNVMLALAPARESNDLRVAYPKTYLAARIEAGLSASELPILPVVQLDIGYMHRLDDPYWPELREALTAQVRKGNVLQWGARVPPPPPRDASTAGAETAPISKSDDPALLAFLLSNPLAVSGPNGLALVTEFVAPTAPPTTAVSASTTSAPAIAAAPSVPPAPHDLPLLAHDSLFAEISCVYNLFNQRTMRTIDAATTRGRNVTLLEPLAQGALGGIIGAATQFHPRDPRASRWSRDQLARIALATSKLAALVKQVPLSAQSSEAAKAQLAANARDPALIEFSSMPALALGFARAAHPRAVLLSVRDGEQWQSALGTWALPEASAALLHRLRDDL